MNRFKEIYFSEPLLEGIYDPSIFKGIFIAGGSGSGKSFITGKVVPGHGFKIINSDILFERMMKKANLDLDLEKLNTKQLIKKDEIRARAKELTLKTKNRFIKNHLGLVIDGTGRDTTVIELQKRRLESNGYDTFMIFVNTSLEVALERNANRLRKLPEDMIKKFWKDTQKNIGRYQNMFGPSNFLIIDNNHVDEKILNKVWKLISKFEKKPIQNPIAKNFIEADKITRGIKQ